MSDKPTPKPPNRLLTFPATLSLLLCVATLAMWRRSHHAGDDLTGWYLRASSGAGSLELFVATRDCFPPPPFAPRWWALRHHSAFNDPLTRWAAWPSHSRQWRCGGFAVRQYGGMVTIPGYFILTNHIPPEMFRRATMGWAVVVPYAFLASIFAIPPAWRSQACSGAAVNPAPAAAAAMTSAPRPAAARSAAPVMTTSMKLASVRLPRQRCRMTLNGPNLIRLPREHSTRNYLASYWKWVTLLRDKDYGGALEALYWSRGTNWTPELLEDRITTFFGGDEPWSVVIPNDRLVNVLEDMARYETPPGRADGWFMAHVPLTTRPDDPKNDGIPLMGLAASFFVRDRLGAYVLEFEIFHL